MLLGAMWEIKLWAVAELITTSKLWKDIFPANEKNKYLHYI
jgi:hypothetical protein